MGIFLRFLNCVNGTKSHKASYKLYHRKRLLPKCYKQNAMNEIFTGESIYFYNSKTLHFFIYLLKSFINCDSKRKMWVPHRSVDFHHLFLAFGKVSLYWSCAKPMFKYEFWWFVYSSIYLFIHKHIYCWSPKLAVIYKSNGNRIIQN